jgi:hypothetical protein
MLDRVRISKRCGSNSWLLLIWISDFLAAPVPASEPLSQTGARGGGRGGGRRPVAAMSQ